MLGLGEPGNYPAALKAITRWFPKNERGLPIAVFSSGGAIGNMIAAPSIAFVALHFGWRAAFVLPGLLGLLWLAGWIILYRMPKEQTGGAELLEPVRTDLAAQPAPSWISLFANRNVMAMVLARFISDPVAYFYIFWIPEYLKHARGFTLVEIGKYAWMPYVAGAIGGMVGGRWSDVLIRKGHSPLSARLSVLYLSAMIAPLGIMTSRVSSASMALALMSVMSFIVYCWFINTAAMIPDIAPEQQAGSILGLIGTSGTFGGMLFNLLVGYLVARSGSYQVVFAIVGSVHVIAAVLLRILLRVPPAERLAWKECHEA
jgi:ACS family hexuronate transporter-like MFS transporter